MFFHGKVYHVIGLRFKGHQPTKSEFKQILSMRRGLRSKWHIRPEVLLASRSIRTYTVGSLHASSKRCSIYSNDQMAMGAEGRHTVERGEICI